MSSKRMPRKLLDILRICYQITNTSNTDVFFKYAANADSYDVYYYIDGYQKWISPRTIANFLTVTAENMDNTLDQLKTLALRIGVEI